MKRQSTAGRRGTDSAEGSSIDLFLLQRFLSEEKSLLLNKAAEFRRNNLVSSSRRSDEADQVSFELDMNSSLTILANDRTKIVQIELALERIRNGSFGNCRACSEPISPYRLRALPLAVLCTSCQEDQEQPELN